MTINSILVITIMVLILVIIFLAIYYIIISAREKKDKNAQKIVGKSETEAAIKEKVAKSYTKESIFNFMEFDKIEDNMIVQKNGKKYLMVIECQGINYDLMSDMEKTSVESGFIQFLNTLRNPIQIYIQTRTVNLEDSIKKYKEKLSKIESDLNSKENRYKLMLESGNYTDNQLKMQKMDIRRQSNLFDYGRDIIFNTERMSMNKNVLRKKYYVILSYFYSNTENEYLKENEVAEMAFSELYTKCQSTIRALALSGIDGKVLDSYELVDLLYNAYNRDEAENYGIEKAEKAGYDDLYVSAPNVLEKKMKAIDEEIKKRALDLAEDSIKFAREDLQKEIEKKEEEFDDLIADFAESLISENEQYLSKELTKESIKKVKETTKKKKEDAKNGKK